MCIDVEFVKGLLKHMSEKLDTAKMLADETKPLAAIRHQLNEAVKTNELLQAHMKGVYTSEGELDWDALMHSVL